MEMRSLRMLHVNLSALGEDDTARSGFDRVVSLGGGMRSCPRNRANEEDRARYGWTEKRFTVEVEPFLAESFSIRPAREGEGNVTKRSRVAVRSSMVNPVGLGPR